MRKERSALRVDHLAGKSSLISLALNHEWERRLARRPRWSRSGRDPNPHQNFRHRHDAEGPVFLTMAATNTSVTFARQGEAEACENGQLLVSVKYSQTRYLKLADLSRLVLNFVGPGINRHRCGQLRATHCEPGKIELRSGSPDLRRRQRDRGNSRAGRVRPAPPS